LIVERDAEDAIRAWAQQNNGNPPVATPASPLNSFVTAIQRQIAGRPATAGPFVLLASYDVRRLVRAFLVRNEVDVPVLSYQELAQDISVQPLGSVGCGARSESSSTRVVVQGNNGAASANELRV
jgi:type III secretion protein V